MNGEQRRMIWLYRIVQLGTLVAVVWKWDLFRLADTYYRIFELDDPFFPAWARSATTVYWAYVLTLGALTCGLVSWNNGLRLMGSVVAFFGLGVMGIHQGTYNDATFITAWWTTLWSIWLATRFTDPDTAKTLSRAALLSRLIIGLIFLGGAVGKWTPEYWDGSVLYEIYFAGRDFWVFNLLRENCTEETLREIAMWYSRLVTGVETCCGFGLWLLPARSGAIVGMVVLTSVALMSNWLLFSVMFSLIGLSTAGLFVPFRR